MNITNKDKRSLIDKEIDNVVRKLSTVEPDSDEYEKIAANLEVLMKAKSYNKGTSKVSADTIAIIAGNLLGIALILGYEQAHVITSKALGFIIKGRV